MENAKLNPIEQLAADAADFIYRDKSIVMDYLFIALCLMAGNIVCGVYSYRTALEFINNIMLIYVDNTADAYSLSVAVNVSWELLKRVLAGSFFYGLYGGRNIYASTLLFIVGGFVIFGSVYFSYNGASSKGEKSKKKDIDIVRAECQDAVDRAYIIAADYMEKSLYKGKLSKEYNEEYAKLMGDAKDKERQCDAQVTSAKVFNARLKNGGDGDIEFAKNMAWFCEVFTIGSGWFFAWWLFAFRTQLLKNKTKQNSQTSTKKAQTKQAKTQNKTAKQTSNTNETNRLKRLVFQSVSGVSVEWGNVNLQTVKANHNTYYRRIKTQGDNSHITAGCLGYVLQEFGEEVKHPDAVKYILDNYK
jgi:hypothetical protein